MLESTLNGTIPYEMPCLSSDKTITRNYLEDGDKVEFTAQVKGINSGGNIGFGTCAGQVLAAKCV
jgi:fumarylacetoacetase